MKLTKAQMEVLQSIASDDFVHFVAMNHKTEKARVIYGCAAHQFREKTVDSCLSLGLIKYELINRWLLTDAGRAALKIG